MIRSISIGELDRFLHEPELPENVERVRTFLQKQLETGESKAEWCYVLDDGVRFLARVVCFVLPGSHPEYGITFFAFDKELSSEARSSFIRDVAMEMHKKVGATIFTHEQRTSSDKYDANVTMLRGAGFLLSSSRLRYTLDIYSFKPPVQLPVEVYEHSLADVGDEEFIEALQIVISNSKDVEDILRIKEYGAGNAAQRFFEMLSNRDSSLERWKIYHTPSGEFVGLVIPQFLGDSTEIGTIGYIGINPSLRSKGYAGLILRRAVSILAQAGALQLVDECDSANSSAIRILEQSGYKLQYEKEIWKLVV